MAGESNVAIAICSSALDMIGDESINSFSDKSRGARSCSLQYERTKLGLLQSHPWRFSVRQALLNRVTGEPPLFGYDYVHQLPSGFLRVIQSDISNNDYQRYGNKIFSNSEVVNIEFQYEPDEVDFPSYFQEVLVARLALVLSLTVKQDQVLHDRLLRYYENQWSRAKVTDSQQQPSQSVGDENFTLIAARNS